MRKAILSASLFIICCCLMASRVNAQDTYEYSAVWYDDYTNTVWGYSATEVDYYCAADYQAYVEGYLYDDSSGLLMDSGWNEEYYIAEVYTSTSADTDSVYTVNSYHDVVAQYYYEDIQKEPEGCMPCDGCNTDCYYYVDNWWWYDPFGFSFTNGGYYGPWWNVYGYGPYTEVENDEYDYLGETSASIPTPTAPHPVHFHQEQGYAAEGGILYFEYNWDSSTGNKADLGNCTVSEYVVYPGNATTYTWPRPPFYKEGTTSDAKQTDNPTISGVAATEDGLADYQRHAGDMHGLYSTLSFTARQRYGYRCSNINNGNWVFMTQYTPIVRSIAQNSNSTWRYTVSKSGVSGGINPLP